jgi:hypothetical protein
MVTRQQARLNLGREQVSIDPAADHNRAGRDGTTRLPLGFPPLSGSREPDQADTFRTELQDVELQLSNVQSFVDRIQSTVAGLTARISGILASTASGSAILSDSADSAHTVVSVQPVTSSLSSVLTSFAPSVSVASPSTDSVAEGAAASPQSPGLNTHLHDFKSLPLQSAAQVAHTTQVLARYREVLQPRATPYLRRVSEHVQPSFLDNASGQFQVVGPAASDSPLLTMLDTGAVPVIFSTRMAARVGLIGSFVRPARVSIILASGTVEEAFGEAVSAVKLRFRNSDTSFMEYSTVPLITPGSGYDVILGRQFQYHVGAVIDNFLGQFSYRPMYAEDSSSLVEHVRLLSNDAVSALMSSAYPTAAAARASIVCTLFTDLSDSLSPSSNEFLTPDALQADADDEYVQDVDDAVQLAAVKSGAFPY